MASGFADRKAIDVAAKGLPVLSLPLTDRVYAVSAESGAPGVKVAVFDAVSYAVAPETVAPPVTLSES